MPRQPALGQAWCDAGDAHPRNALLRSKQMMLQRLVRWRAHEHPVAITSRHMRCLRLQGLGLIAPSMSTSLCSRLQGYAVRVALREGLRPALPGEVKVLVQVSSK